MFVPKTSHPRGTPLKEYRVGKGDYIIGGAWTMPFSGLDSPLRRRPMVFGEVCMHDGTDDPVMRSIMWRDLGADGICLRIAPGDGQVISAIATATAMPLMVTGTCESLEEAASSVEDSVMVLVPEDDGAVDEHGHLLVGKHIISFPPTTLGEGLRPAMDEGLRIRAGSLASDEPGCPTMCDVTSSTDDVPDCEEGLVNILESQAALAAMLAGADMVVMRNPTAVDTAIGYGEELADL